MRSLLAVPVLATLLSPAPAKASGCFRGPYATTIDPALGCDVVVLAHPDAFQTDFTVITTRGTETVDLTGAITTSTRDIEVRYTNYDCDGGVIADYKTLEPYYVYRIALSGAQVGDVLTVTGHGGVGTVQATGACTEDMSSVTPFCTGRNSGYPCEGDAGGGTGDDANDDDANDDDAVGCNASGNAAAVTSLLLLALCGMRSRRPRHPR